MVPVRRLAVLATILVAAGFAALAIPRGGGRGLLLSGLVDVPQSAPAVTARRAPLPPEGPPLHVAIGAMISPERTFIFYSEFFQALAARLKRPLELRQRKTYEEVNALVEGSEVEIAWICTGAWPGLRARKAARLLAVPVVDGKVTYQALLLAGPASGGADSLPGLKGMRFAFTDPISLSGCRFPKRELARMGLSPESFFGGTFFTNGHDRSIEAVRRGLAAGASVDSLVYDYLVRRFPEEVEGVRVVGRSEAFPIPPLVVPSSTSAAAEATLREALLSLAGEPRERAILAALMIDGFRSPDASAYARLE